jgi:hypothetical protein
MKRESCLQLPWMAFRLHSTITLCHRPSAFGKEEVLKSSGSGNLEPAFATTKLNIDEADSESVDLQRRSASPSLLTSFLIAPRSGISILLFEN